jgi:hypothetical protein
MRSRALIRQNRQIMEDTALINQVLGHVKAGKEFILEMPFQPSPVWPIIIESLEQAEYSHREFENAALWMKNLPSSAVKTPIAKSTESPGVQPSSDSLVAPTQ